ncbi:MAG: hypothetical protein QOE70_4382 [Chthoniobacter sp.]|jgi:hypothetical protein|nr:hypothetical protein [Chthoniobacter sp.]
MSDPENIYTATNRLLGTVAPQLTREGQEFNLRGITLPHYPVKDTALAACLATLGIPFRDPAPFTDDVGLSESGSEIGRTTVWWLGDVSQGGGEDAHKTEEILGAWIERAKMELEHPFHPLVTMRAALDARQYWVTVLQSHREGRALLPIEATGQACYATDSIHGAAVLKACGFAPIAFSGRSFFLQRVKDGVAAPQVLLTAALNEGATPPQWMSRVLFNYSHLLKIAKGQSLIIRQSFDGDQTLLLTADSTTKTRDKFHALL